MTARDPLVLAIESSCDETAAAVLDAPTSLRASVVHSQIELHAQYGGVVPELASRAHVMALPRVVQSALDEAGVGPGDVGGIAVTQGPGLVGALLCGIEFAKGLALAWDVPLVGVHHLEGHIFAPFLATTPGFDPPEWPFLALIVSGGHTSLYACRMPGRYEELGHTVDDAAGEAYDKLSKLLGMGYPGGAAIDARAQRGDASRVAMPRPMLAKGGFNFSFSGLKTAAAQLLDACPGLSERDTDDLCASFQEAAVDVLVTKALRAAKRSGLRHIIASGGVACNARLRSALLERGGAAGLRVSVAPPWLCTDNAAMIGAAGFSRVRARVRAGSGFGAHGLDARPAWPLSIGTGD